MKVTGDGKKILPTHTLRVTAIDDWMCSPQTVAMKFIDEFREFAVKGNAMDLAIGVVIGAAFQKIVTSLVDDVIMPPIGFILGRVDFSNLFINFSATEVTSVADAKAKGIATLNYGLFINQIVNFVIVAFALFMIVKVMNRLRRIQEKKEEKAEAKK